MLIINIIHLITIMIIIIIIIIMIIHININIAGRQSGRRGLRLEVGGERRLGPSWQAWLAGLAGLLS